MAANQNDIVGSIVIQKYELTDFEEVKEIGRGGEATVYKGWHNPQGTNFAMKVIRDPDPLGTSISSRINISEAEILIKHSMHENIMRVYGLLLAERKQIGYVMEFMEYGSLHRTIHNAKINYDMRQVYSWIRQAANGLQYLHQHKIIHRDVKPANILLGNSLDVLKISDFGLAKLLNKDISTITGGIGTISYMSPEVINHQKYSFPSDIYALSITIWEMSHRKKPYEEFADKSLYWLSKQITEKNKRPSINKLPQPALKRSETNGDSLLNSLFGWYDLLKRGWDANPKKRPDLSEFINFARTNLKESDTSQVLHVGTNSEYTQSSDQKIVLPFREQIKNSVMILGFLRDDICIFNSNQNKWNELHLRLPRNLCNHGSVMINGEIYIFGGCEGQECFKELYKLGENLEWIKLSDMNEKRSGIGNSSVAFDDEIWVFGGFNETNTNLNSVEKYNPKTNTWTLLEMKNVRTHSAVSIINGKFYISGGFDGENVLKTIEVYDPEEKEWESFCEMPFALSDHVSIADGTNLMIIGGIKSSKPSDEVWKIDILDPEKKWIKISNLNKKRYCHSAVKLSDGLMVIGGTADGLRIIETLEIFDGRKWTERKIEYLNGRRGFSLIPLTAKNEELFLQRDDILKR